MFAQTSQKLDKGLVAPYQINKLIAKTGNAHNISESLILPSVSIIISDVVNLRAKETIQVIPLSNSTAVRRIDEVARNSEEELVSLVHSKKFSLQLDKTSLQNNDAFLMACVRFWNGNEMMKEILFARRIKTDTIELSIFEEVKNYSSENNIPMQNIIASMVGRYRGFIAHLKKVIPSVFAIHCVIHRERLVAKDLGERLNFSLLVIIKAVNFIKSHALQDRLFRQLYKETDEDFRTQLLHTKVRWLSKGNCLKRFVILWDTIVFFVSDKQHEERLVDAKADIFYLADIFQKLNLLKKTLQDKNSNFVDVKEVIVSFLKKLEVYWHNIGRR
ncbi:protein FAM200C-like [Tachypleus tridentatus]|uniref:protein FAM200C-like n=1 Tax=Tachypleus tridentatus TaxID=6853 RepID=UPI003FD3D138